MDIRANFERVAFMTQAEFDSFLAYLANGNLSDLEHYVISCLVVKRVAPYPRSPSLRLAKFIELCRRRRGAYLRAQMI